MFEMPDKLKERVVANYKASLLRQIYKIVLQIEGSATRRASCVVSAPACETS